MGDLALFWPTGFGFTRLGSFLDEIGVEWYTMWDKTPVLIPTFNNPTHLRGMVAQLHRLGLFRVEVIDNASTFPPMLELLAELERNGVRVIRRKENAGPRAVISSGLPQFFCLTDPDLQFNPDLPRNFLEKLAGLTERYKIGKAGFALDISEPEKMLRHSFEIKGRLFTITEWEGQFWKHSIGRLDGVAPVYNAIIDTTFAIYNRAYFSPQTFWQALRVAGPYTAKHLPWYRNHRLPSDEWEFYIANSKRGAFVGRISKPSDKRPLPPPTPATSATNATRGRSTDDIGRGDHDA